jgi:ribonuclease HII
MPGDALDDEMNRMYGPAVPTRVKNERSNKGSVVGHVKNSFVSDKAVKNQLKAPEKYIYQETIIRGDIHNWLIATASVIAKVHRDAKMCRYSQKYPQYEFHNNKGYGTKRHYELIRKHGMCTLHRKMWIKQ